MSLTGRMGGWAPEPGLSSGALGILQTPPPFVMPKVDMSPEAQMRWALEYIRRRYVRQHANWIGAGYWPPEWPPITGDARTMLEVLRRHTGQWMTIGALMRRAGLDGRYPGDALDEIVSRGIQLEFTRSAEHHELVIAHERPAARGAALLRVRLP